MSEEAASKKEEGSGAPAWVMTFADLMSLLMCFFVLLLSFSEMDLLKFKQIAGSMKNAFGVQQEIKTDHAPKGTSIIAREFSPGRPTPTLINEIRQNTIDETKQTLEFTDAVTEEEDIESESIDSNEESEGSGMDAMQRQPQHMPVEIPHDADVAMLSDQDAEKLSQSDVEVNEQEDKDQNKAEMTETHEKTIIDAYKLLKTLEPEIEQGLIAIKTQGNKILLRINEKGSFPSGSSTVKGSFLPVLNKIRKSLNEIDGRIVVAGHTDNVPIKTARFRSNWELSASRAVTVVHELLVRDSLSPDRFVIEGRGDAYPMAPNDSAKNRALNRRVELTIVQGDDHDVINEISADPDNPFTKKFKGDDTPELTTSVHNILNEEIDVPDQAKIDALHLQQLKNKFNAIRQGLLNQ